MKKRIHTESAPQAIGPYSQAVTVDGWLFASGQVALDPATGQMLEGDVTTQTRRVMENLKAVLAAAGADFSAVVKTTVYLNSMDDFAAMNEVYGSYFEDPPPARAAVEVARLPKDADVEIDLVARLL